MSDNTVYALSTAAGKSGVAVFRVSGSDALAVVRCLTALDAGAVVPRHAYFTSLHDLAGEVLDHALVLYFKAPASFTGEDTVEIHSHGSRAVIAAVLENLGRLDGFRLAEPGEFSKRAFYNGKMDLTEAEGLADLIDAETREQQKYALRQMEGGLKNLYDGWREKLVEILPLLCDPDLEKLCHFLREQYRLTKRRTADRPPSISLRLPCPEHLNLRFVRILVDAFRLHNELLTPVKRKRPLIFLVDTQRQARFAQLCILQQRFANALGTRSFCNENPLDVVLRQANEAVDLPGGFVLVDIELRLREHIAHRLKMVCPKARRNKWMGVEVAVQPDLHDRV